MFKLFKMFIKGVLCGVLNIMNSCYGSFWLFSNSANLLNHLLIMFSKCLRLYPSRFFCGLCFGFLFGQSSRLVSKFRKRVCALCCPLNGSSQPVDTDHARRWLLACVQRCVWQYGSHLSLLVCVSFRLKKNCLNISA